MSNFLDEIKIIVVSGNGGNGLVSFRREKGVPRGGPDGGDGGRGGDIIFISKSNISTLSHLDPNATYKAENGLMGLSKNMHGRSGKSLIIEVPLGTIIKDFQSQTVIVDLDKDNMQFTLLKGGRGGRGNTQFKGPVNQAPKRAEKGRHGESLEIKLELNIIADIGFVGFPNAGKSSLLKVLTKANPKIAPYPFTTKVPNLGILKVGYDLELVLADIPGIIEGAKDGVGLGIKFLKHILRTRALAFLIDLQDENYKRTFDLLINELYEFNLDFKDKKKIIIGTKSDLIIDLDELNNIQKKFLESFPNETCLIISSHTHHNIENLIQKLVNIKKELV